MKEIGYCHECEYYKEDSNNKYMGFCENEKNIIVNLNDVDSSGIYVVNDDKILNVGLNFGCIHFEQKTEELDNFEDNANY